MLESDQKRKQETSYHLENGRFVEKKLWKPNQKESNGEQADNRVPSKSKWKRRITNQSSPNHDRNLELDSPQKSQIKEHSYLAYTDFISSIKTPSKVTEIPKKQDSFEFELVRTPTASKEPKNLCKLFLAKSSRP